MSKYTRVDEYMISHKHLFHNYTLRTYFGSIDILVAEDSAVNPKSPCYHGACIWVGVQVGRQTHHDLRNVLLEVLKEDTLSSQIMCIIGAVLLLWSKVGTDQWEPLTTPAMLPGALGSPPTGPAGTWETLFQHSNMSFIQIVWCPSLSASEKFCS